MRYDNLFTLGFAVLFFVVVLMIYSLVNPQLEQDCLSKGGQVVTHIGQYSSCILSAK